MRLYKPTVKAKCPTFIGIGRPPLAGFSEMIAGHFDFTDKRLIQKNK
jgi:hypothetical protein